uniref:Uncharacterized protein n=1 Tax=Aegilops tauschii subsp. strangulata TaxID=200361 RepID=A0A453C7P6_AEGTS
PTRTRTNKSRQAPLVLSSRTAPHTVSFLPPLSPPKTRPRDLSLKIHPLIPDPTAQISPTRIAPSRAPLLPFF